MASDLQAPDAARLFGRTGAPGINGAYVALTNPVVPFLLGAMAFVQQQTRLPGGQVREAEATGQMLSLDRRWFGCQVKSLGRAAWVEKPESPIEPGMSGSPIVGPDGKAIAAVSVSDQHGEGGPNPLLNDVLPGWLLRARFSKSAKRPPLTFATEHRAEGSLSA